MEQMQPQGVGQAQPGGEFQAGLYQYVPGTGFMAIDGQQGAVGGGDDMGAARAAEQAAAQAVQAAGQAAAAAQAAGQAAQAAGQAASAVSDQGLNGQGMPEGTQPKFDQNKLGEMFGVVGDVMNGEAKPEKLLGLLQDSGGDFWKGALVGAAVVFLVNNDTVKKTVSGAFGSLFGSKAGADGADAAGTGDKE